MKIVMTLHCQMGDYWEACPTEGPCFVKVHRMRHDLAILSAQLSAMQHNLIAGASRLIVFLRDSK